MPMTKEAKHDALMTKTEEVCVRVLFKNGASNKAYDQLMKLAEGLEGFVTHTHGYVETAEHDEIDGLVDQLDEEVFDRLADQG